jgi:hypothetical protein
MLFFLGKSFVFAIMKKVLKEENCDHLITRVTFTKDKTVNILSSFYLLFNKHKKLKGLVFDIKTEFEETIDSKWYNTKTLILERINELPELEDGWQNDSGNGGGRGFGNGGGGGGFGGDRRGGRGKFDSRGGNKSGGFGGGNRSGGFGGGNRGGFGKDNSFNNKRKFSESNGGGNDSSNKKIKFTD